MDRRKFIKITGLGIGVTVLSSSLSGCSAADKEEQYGWNAAAHDEKDIRLKVLSYAVLSPNPHNKQPWQVQLTGPLSFDLYVDLERLLPATDPYFRQIHIAQGTFLESIVIAASGFNHEVKIEYFPQGMYGNQELLDKPVASVTLVPKEGITADPLFSQLLVRHSNKRPYLNQGLSETEVAKLKTFHGENNEYPLTITNSAEAKSSFEQILTEAMSIEVGNREREHETIAMFRFNDDEVNKYRDGFGLPQSGVTGIKKFVAENLFLSRESVEKDPTSFSEQSVELAQKAAASTNTFAWISSASNTRLDQLKVGRSYFRINLLTSMMGLAQHPMSQVLQEYEDNLQLQARLKSEFNIKGSDTVQMLFRLGRAEATQHSPRRLVTELIKS